MLKLFALAPRSGEAELGRGAKREVLKLFALAPRSGESNCVEIFVMKGSSGGGRGPWL